MSQPHVQGWQESFDTGYSSPSGLQSGSFDPHSYAVACDPWSRYPITPYEISTPDISQETYETHPPPHSVSDASRGTPETLFQDAQETLLVETQVTPGQDVASNYSFHTAVGDVGHDDNTAEQNSHSNLIRLADDTDDMGLFRCNDCHIDLWDAFEHS